MVIKLLQGVQFKEFVRAYGDKTQVEMAELWFEEISDRTISKTLEKIGFIRKKTYGYRERGK